MYCEKCGTEITNGSMFCHNCGAKIENVQQPADDNKAAAASTQAPSAEKPQTSGYAVASLVTGIVGLFFCGIILGVLAIVFSFIAKNKNGGVRDGLSTAGLVMGIIALVVGVVIVIVAVALAATAASMIVPAMMNDMLVHW